MAITYPTSPSFREITLGYIDTTFSSKAHSGKRYVRKIDSHLWKFTLTYPPLTKSDFAPVLAAVNQARGMYETFTVTPPNLATPLGTQTADTNVAANASAGSTSISLSGATAGNTFVAGDILKISSHNKVYMITANTTASGGGLATLSINPPLIESITTAHTIKHSNVPFTVALVGDIQEFKTSVSGLVRYELDVEEVI